MFPEDSFDVSRDNLKVVIFKLEHFACNSKKGDRAGGLLVRECGPRSANHVNATKSTREAINFRSRMIILFILSYP